jgi:hypothetical protein
VDKLGAPAGMAAGRFRRRIGEAVTAEARGHGVRNSSRQKYRIQ